MFERRASYLIGFFLVATAISACAGDTGDFDGHDPSDDNPLHTGGGSYDASGGTPGAGGDTMIDGSGGAVSAGGASSGGMLGAGGHDSVGTGSVGQGGMLVLQENAAGFCAFDGAIETEHGGYTGSGYANGSNFTGAGMEWSVAAAGGSVELSWRYAAPTSRPATLFVNDVEVAAVAFTSSGAWTTWIEASATAILAPGDNVVRLEADTADGLANLDSLTVTGLGLAAADCPEPDPIEPPGNSGIIGFATQNGGTTGGQGGQVVTVSSYADLKSYAESATPYVIMVEGTISNGSAGGQINVGANKSLIGVGSTAFLSGVGLNLSSRNNIVIRNLRLSLVGVSNPSGINGGDLISIQGTSKNIWIDHCELFSEDPNTQTNIDKYDGLIDIKGQTGFITISWNYLHDHHKGGLVGAADDDLYADRKVTLHHNYYNKVKLRVPMYRGSTGHFFNNYIVGAQDATEIRAGTCVRVEKNYYEALNHSIYTPSDSPGSTQRIDNIEVQHSSRAYPGNCTANIPYDYASVLIQNTQDVKTLVPAYAGVGKL